MSKNSELRQQIVRSLSLSQLQNVDAQGEATIENEADRLVDIVEQEKLKARIEENDWSHDHRFEHAALDLRRNILKNNLKSLAQEDK